VHRWDAESAVDAAPAIGTNLSCLGIDEVVADLFPRQIALGRTADMSCSVEIAATDTDRRWTLSPKTASTGASLRASAEVLFLLLWRRVGLDDPRVEFIGPDQVRDELLAARFTP